MTFLRSLLSRLASKKPEPSRLKILYFSVHQILEFDEISILNAIGCDVFPLGSSFGGRTVHPFRPTPPLPSFIAEWTQTFFDLGGRYEFGTSPSEMVIPRDFVKMFDAVIVMHEFDFIDTHWPSLSEVPVIWRAIGVGTQVFEHRVVSLRERGVTVVRYCPTESRADGYAGHDALIRFGKMEPVGVWTGERPEVLTFSNSYRARFPQEYDFYVAATAGIPALLGGNNEDLTDALGSVSYDEQFELYRTCSTYFYSSGTFIPYTLNFMEAWLTGIPLVAINCRALWPDEMCKFAEIPDLIEHGRNGFIVNSAEEAAEVFHLLSADRALAERIGSQGAADAARLFSADVVKPQWRTLLDQVVKNR